MLEYASKAPELGLTMTKIISLIRRYSKANDGGFALGFALTLTTLLALFGAAVEVTSLHSYTRKSQNRIDSAALAAAKYMADNLVQTKSEADFQKHKKSAEKVADAILSDYLNAGDFVKSSTTYDITEDHVKVFLNVERKPMIMGIVGVKKLPIQVSSTASLAHEGIKDVDIVLMTDATGSMFNQLTAIQDNMKDFTTDLQLTLDSSNIKLGNVRVKFIFFRDYMVDNDARWTGRDMIQEDGMEAFGPMYESNFYELPSEKDEMDNYVDFFVAEGGGSFEESGIDAFWHGLSNPDWNSGDTTVRSMVLWTDATPRALGNYDESYALTPEAELLGTYFTDAYWDLHLGPDFTALNEIDREAFMYEYFYPSDEIPTTMTLTDMKIAFENFHAENANGKTGIKTFFLNIIDGCGGFTSCGDWEEFKSWEGAEVIEDSLAVSSTETYQTIIEQVADTIRSQVAARDIAIIN